MGDRIAVMRRGVRQQLGKPEEIHDEPANLFVASFISSPAMNLLEGTIDVDRDDIAVQIDRQRLPIPPKRLAEAPALRRYAKQVVGIGIRPEHLQDPAAAPPGFDGRLTGRVGAGEVLGSEVLAHLEVGANRVIASEVQEVADSVDPAETIRIGHERKSHQTVCLSPVAPVRSRQPIGEPFTAAVATSDPHFFDLATGIAIRS